LHDVVLHAGVKLTVALFPPTWPGNEAKLTDNSH